MVLDFDVCRSCSFRYRKLKSERFVKDNEEKDRAKKKNGRNLSSSGDLCTIGCRSGFGGRRHRGFQWPNLSQLC